MTIYRKYLKNLFENTFKKIKINIIKMQYFRDIKNAVYQKGLSVYSKLTKPHDKSEFLSKGILMPSEFVEAGDYLTNISPTWEWKSFIDEQNKNIYLPDEKQFLISRVPCYGRYKGATDFFQELINMENEDVFICFDKYNEKNKEENKENIEEVIEIKFDHFKNEERYDVDVNNPEKIRYYDISIVYDMAFFTPRLFLMGYDDFGNPLKPDDIFKDISDEYARKTVTIETHPILNISQASIHPCKHAEVIKNMTDIITSNGGTVNPNQSLILFLKIFTSVIPNIKYDTSLD